MLLWARIYILDCRFDFSESRKTKAMEGEKMEKCKLCDRQTDGRSGLYCARCDKFQGEAFIELRTWLEQ
jgi:hypothetical protein